MIFWGPPGVGKTTQLRLTDAQYAALQEGGFATGQGGPQTTFARVKALVRTTDGKAVASVTDRELDGLRTAARMQGGGGWQDWAREVLAANGVLSPTEN